MSVFLRWGSGCLGGWWAFHFLLFAWGLRPHASGKNAKAPNCTHKTHNQLGTLQIEFLLVHVSRDSGKLYRIIAHDMGLTQWPATTLSEMVAACSVWTAASCCSPATSWHMMPRMPGTKRNRTRVWKLCWDGSTMFDSGTWLGSFVTSPSISQDQTDRVICWAFHFLLFAWDLRPHASGKRAKAPNSTHKTHNQLGTLQIEFLLVHVSRDSGKLYRIIAHDMGLTQWPATTLSEMVAACAVWTAASCCSPATSWHMMPRMPGTKRNRTRVWKLCWDGSTMFDSGTWLGSFVTSPSISQDQTDRVICWAFHFLLFAWGLRSHASGKNAKAPSSTHKTHNQLGTLQIEFLLVHVSRDSGKLYRIIAHDMGLTQWPVTTLSEMVAACAVSTAASCCSPATSWHMMPRMPGTKRNRTRAWKLWWDGSTMFDSGTWLVSFVTSPSISQDQTDRVICWAFHFLLFAWGLRSHASGKNAKAPNSTHKTHNQLGTLQIEFLLAHVSRDSGKLYRIIAHDMGLTQWPATTLSEMVAACAVWTAASCCSPATSWHMMPRMPGTKRNRTMFDSGTWLGSFVTSPSISQDQTDRVICWAFHFLLFAWGLRSHASGKNAKAPNSTHKTHNQLGTLQIEFLLAHVSRDSGKLYRIIAHDMGLTQWPATTLSEMVASCSVWTAASCCSLATSWHMMPRMPGTKRNRTRVWQLCWDGSTMFDSGTWLGSFVTSPSISQDQTDRVICWAFHFLLFAWGLRPHASGKRAKAPNSTHKTHNQLGTLQIEFLLVHVSRDSGKLYRIIAHDMGLTQWPATTLSEMVAACAVWTAASCCSPATSWHMMPRMPVTKRNRTRVWKLCWDGSTMFDSGTWLGSFVTSPSISQDQTDRVICWAFHFLLFAWGLRPHASGKNAKAPNCTHKTHNQLGTLQIEFLLVHVSRDSGKLYRIIAHDMGLTQWPATTLSEMVAACSVWTAASCCSLAASWHMMPRMLGTKRNRTRVWKLCWDGSTVRLRHMTWEFALNMRYHLHPTRPNRPFEPATSCFLPGIWLKAPSNTSAQGVSLKTASLLLLRS